MYVDSKVLVLAVIHAEGPQDEVVLMEGLLGPVSTWVLAEKSPKDSTCQLSVSLYPPRMATQAVNLVFYLGILVGRYLLFQMHY